MMEPNQVPDSELNEWQIDEIKKALTEADAGEFASDADVLQAIRKWKYRSS
jgi:predicted transcriptional regulator